MAVVVYSVNPYLALLDKSKGAGEISFAFNGVDQYATMPAWTPLGLPFTIKIEGYAVTLGGTASTLMGTTGATWDAVILASSVWNLRYEDALASQQVLVDGTAVADSPGRLEIYYTADGISFESIDPASVETALYIPGMELTTIAGPDSGLSDFFHGNVVQIAFLDSSPIQDTDALMGNGARYIEIPEFTIAAGDDFNVSLDTMRWNVALTAGRGLLGGDGTALLVNNTDTNRVGVATDAGISNFTALAGLADGQHYALRLTRVGGVVTCYVDGVAQDLPIANSGDFSQKIIYANGIGASQLSGNKAIQNVILENLTTGEAIGYKVDDNNGLVVAAYDIVNGEFGAPVPAKNGAITPDADWQYIPDNTRHYPMNEGEGATLLCYDGNGDPVPTNDATIQAYTDNWE